MRVGVDRSQLIRSEAALVGAINRLDSTGDGKGVGFRNKLVASMTKSKLIVEEEDPIVSADCKSFGYVC